MNKILLALLAGTVIGILIAPDKGSETIRKLRNRLNDYKDQVGDEIDELTGKGEDILRKGATRINEAID